MSENIYGMDTVLSTRIEYALLSNFNKNKCLYHTYKLIHDGDDKMRVEPNTEALLSDSYLMNYYSTMQVVKYFIVITKEDDTHENVIFDNIIDCRYYLTLDTAKSIQLSCKVTACDGRYVNSCLIYLLKWHKYNNDDQLNIHLLDRYRKEWQR